MRYITFLFALISFNLFGQVKDVNITISSSHDPDSVYLLSTRDSGARAGRGNFLNLPNVAELLAPYLGIASGVYTPTASNLVNITGSPTATQAQWMRVGNTVTVSGRITLDAFLTSTQTSFEIDLPIASDIGATEDVAGVSCWGGSSGIAISVSGEIIGVVANNTAKVFFNSGQFVSNGFMTYQFTYQII